MRTEALARGIRAETLDAALSTLAEPLLIVLERDRSQAEKELTLEQYVARRLTPKLIASGHEMLAAHRPVLDEVSERYGVPAEIIAAVWGIESNYGRFSGVRPTVAALATLAWDPRRSALFRSELFAALEILDHGDVEVSRMRGSWAGAMGQVQFMPSSYLQYAQDFDNDGRRDIWSSPPDVFASIANFLKGHGWQTGQRWGLEVGVDAQLAEPFAEQVERGGGSCQARRDMKAMRSMAEWQRLGVRLPSGKDLPASEPDAALVVGATRRFLVHANYDALLEYNCAHPYAISVGLLAGTLNGSQALSRSNTRRAPKKAARRRRRHRHA